MNILNPEKHSDLRARPTQHPHLIPPFTEPDPLNVGEPWPLPAATEPFADRARCVCGFENNGNYTGGGWENEKSNNHENFHSW